MASRLSKVGGAGVRLARPRLTGRTMMVAAMALFLLVVLASPFQTYLNRRASVATSEKQQRDLAAKVAGLQAQNDLWKDPAYVERQARVRLQYIRPGDTLYTVLDSHGQPLAPATPLAAPAKVAKPSRLPSWNSQLWASVQDAAR
ncbi:MAG TPA: septum formation initiator family protein [Jatrophihabitans sp.]|nr:septum formation initiator family protein [Jatrophihabitans sp.]